MRFLHTSDWHLGKMLYGRKRYQEFIQFLDWLALTIEQQHIDALLVAGDIFDTTSPSNRAQQLYYDFLFKISKSNCKHVVVIAGNHDSPSFINAPKTLLKSMNIHVIGNISDNLADEVIVLYEGDIPKAIVCAVPYLRDKDVRIVEAGETIEDKNANLIAGVKRHYEQVCAIAEQKRNAFIAMGYSDLPIIAMGHLFTAGGKVVDGDGVRDLYVGNLAHVNKSIFPEIIDYLALGHLHIPQIVANTNYMRYSGSPIPIGYGEAEQQKIVLIIEFNGKQPTKIEEFKIPTFQKLLAISGNLEQILMQINQLKHAKSHAWLEIEYRSDKIATDLRRTIELAVADSQLEVLRIKNASFSQNSVDKVPQSSLEDLNAKQIFELCLNANAVIEEERPDLIKAYNEILQELSDEDANAD